MSMDGKGAHTRRLVLDAAIARFARDGYRGASVADVARDAGVGGTVAYSYFPNKEALFLAAVDEDAAAVIAEGMSSLPAGPGSGPWHEPLFFALLDAVGRHPLARRMLAGLEPDITERVLDIPALAELRKGCADLLQAEQLSGGVRDDIDPVTFANGLVAVTLSLLMSAVQLGGSEATPASAPYATDIAAVLNAAIEAPTPRRQHR